MATAEERYPPIGDYGIIGDCHTVALVSRQGSIDWLCLPNFSSPAVFAALLDHGRGGCFAIRPRCPFRAQRRYVGATNVLETTFITEGGRARLTDFMPILVKPEFEGLLRPQREVTRIVEGLEGEVELEVVFEPRPDYARVKRRLQRRGKLGWAFEHRDHLLLLNADVPLEMVGDGASLRGVVRLAAGSKHTAALGFMAGDVGVVPLLGRNAEARLRATLDWWEAWAGKCIYAGPYRDAVLRSILVLKLLTFSLSGAVVAAATASLPEKVGGSRNWDYRFCWLRDAGHTLESFIDLGYRAEGEAFFEWLLHTTRLTWPRLQVLYDVYGETDLPEQELDHLEGYQGSIPVRIGNAAQGQRQLDIYGEVSRAASDYVARGGRLDRSEARLLAGFGDFVCRSWHEPDHGIWEFRGPPRHNTHSKLMCWVALDRLVRLHDEGHVRVPKDHFQRERDAIREVIERRGFNDRLNSYVGVLDGDDADAALLLMPHCGYLPADHPRMIGTWEHLRRRLEQNDLFFRYVEGYDGLPGGENAFGACCFWAVGYLARLGELDEASRRFECLSACANDLGLYGEEIEPRTGAAVGNFPQAFTHAGLVTAVLALAGHRARTRG